MTVFDFKTYPLFTRFSILSLILFILIGYFIITGLAPALKDFIIAKHELESVIFYNRLANRFLTPEDFIFPLKPERQKAAADFIANAYTPGSFLFFITDSRGKVIYVEPSVFSEQFIGSSLAGNYYVNYVIREHNASAGFVNVTPEEKPFLNMNQAFAQATPITFGDSVEMIGMVYAVSRVGFITETIGIIEKSVGLRIIIGFLTLYLLLSIIVGNASLVIHRQHGELKDLTRRQIEQTQELARLKDQFVFIAAHELRSPVTVIGLSLEMLEKAKSSLTGQAKELLEDINRQTGRLKDLINDLLDASKLEAGKFSLKSAVFSLPSFLTDYIETLKPLGRKHKITLFLEISDDAPKEVFADQARLREVLSNFVTNAIKYNKEGGSVRITIGLNPKQKDELLFQVKDSGIGISDEDQQHVFERFWRADEVKNIEGTGLGLWIAKQIIERWDGRVGMRSKAEIGSDFYFTLPIITAAKIKTSAI
ncbi:MAG: HAMP domain-containing histidine kinase [Candidatus Brennerbacteria bacterium]|nr:HAMP domain-containing histidine kinase [Candidatus Brennerbacteria bacterium]